MSAYVDSLKPSIKNHNWQHDKSCHLVADTEKELHTFAASIGMNMLWFQKRLILPHYDLTEGMRKKAVKAGAIEITDVQLVDMMAKSRREVKVKTMEVRMKTIIAGSRDITDYSILESAIVQAGWRPTTVISGTARGVDLLGERWALENNVPVERCTADWAALGKKAGYVRNEFMAKNADALIALWDGQSKGTKHMIDVAKKAGLQVFIMQTDKRKEETEMPAETKTFYQDDDSRLDCSDYPNSEEMPVLAFDTETELITYENPIPDLICMSYANAGDVRGSLKTPWEHAIDQQLVESFTSGQHSVGHNVSFDLSILAFKYPDLLPHIFNALDNGLIHDTLIREKLLMLTMHGNFEMIEVNGCCIRLGYKLTDLEQKYLKIDRSHLKDDEDAPRLNYAMYKGVNLEKWDGNFIDYAVDDAINCGLIYQEQEKARQFCIETTGHDPFMVEAFRVKVSFALRLLECVGSRMDPGKVLEVTERFRTEYAQPRLRDPLLAAGLLLEAVPEMPYKNGALDHTDECTALKDEPDTKKARKAKTCGCAPKMKAPEKEKSPTKPLFQHIWNLAHKNPNIKALPSDGCAAQLRKDAIYDSVILDGAFMQHIIGMEVDAETGDAILPGDIKLKTDEAWSSTYAALNPLLSIWAERKALRKIITDYLPKMYYRDADGNETPATTIRGSFYPLCLTGRSSSSASKLYPSRNEQNVDPRVRPCTIPRDGNIIISTDYSGMELGTLAQKCINLFGHSIMADNINKGIDNHAYLAAQIAAHLDEDFGKYLVGEDMLGNSAATYQAFIFLKTHKQPCGAPTFCENFKTKYRQEESKELDRPVLWSDFFDYYRLLAKPTGLGFPGGLGAATMISFAKGGYKVDLSLEVAKKLREIWLETYPEMRQYLDWIKKSCQDPNHSPIEIEEPDGTKRRQVFFCYDTPRGMHRSRCGFCEAANGAGLQAFSAEGALEALYRVQKRLWLAEDVDVLSGAFAINFLHDEILWESPDDDKAGDRVRIIEKIMVDAMNEITPDVKAGAESAAMRRWYKKAKSIYDEAGNIIPWEPETEKKGI